MRVLSFGEILWDVIGEDAHIGGAPLNFAGHLARLGAESWMASALGRDELGRKARAFLKETGVRDELVGESDVPTGRVLVTLTDGIPRYDILEGVAWDSIEPDGEALERAAAEPWDCLYFGSLAQRTEENRRALTRLRDRVEARQVFLDVNLRPPFTDPAVLAASVELATVLKLNDEELPVIADILGLPAGAEDDRARRVRERLDLDVLVLTRGKEGARLYGRQETADAPPDLKAKAVDTVGAGDSFSAGFVYAWHVTGDLARSGRFAAALADFVVTRSGALPEYPPEVLAARDALGKA